MAKTASMVHSRCLKSHPWLQLSRASYLNTTGEKQKNKHVLVLCIIFGTTSYSGWWFGTWLLWLSIWEFHPNWLSLHHFSEGRYTTNQYFPVVIQNSMVFSTINHPHHPFINGGRSTTSQISNQLYLNHLSICMNPISWWLEESAGQTSFWITFLLPVWFQCRPSIPVNP